MTSGDVILGNVTWIFDKFLIWVVLQHWCAESAEMRWVVRFAAAPFLQPTARSAWRRQNPPGLVFQCAQSGCSDGVVMVELKINNLYTHITYYLYLLYYCDPLRPFYFSLPELGEHGNVNRNVIVRGQHYWISPVRVHKSTEVLKCKSKFYYVVPVVFSSNFCHHSTRCLTIYQPFLCRKCLLDPCTASWHPSLCMLSSSWFPWKFHDYPGPCSSRFQ